ncbi:hypothetical protein ACIGZH_01585 [Streptomyces sp. NPDC058319]|uniref:hypothetical protein n=1 Tax=unclassified Streptomyces TaxID=2593676 RepID=UPI0036E656EF
MPTAGDQVPGGPSDIGRRLAALEREVRELRAARRLENASIGAGGLRIDGGRFAMDTPAGARMVDIGPIADPVFDHGDGSQQQAIWLRRDDGSLFFACYAYPPAGNGETQAWAYYDRSGNAVLAEDTASGAGLARPWLPLNPPVSSDASTWPRGTSGAFATIASCWNTKWQPKLRVYGVTAAVGTATGEVRLTVDGTPWGPTVAAGGVIDFTSTVDAATGGLFQLEVQARRLTGTGSIACQITLVHGYQT